VEVSAGGRGRFSTHYPENRSKLLIMRGMPFSFSVVSLRGTGVSPESSEAPKKWWECPANKRDLVIRVGHRLWCHLGAAVNEPWARAERSREDSVARERA